MAHSDDDYRTLKPTDDSRDPYRTLAPTRTPAPSPVRRSEAKPVEPAVVAPVVVEAPRPAVSPATDPLSLLEKPAALFCGGFALGDEARRFLDEKQTLIVYLYRLVKERLHLDAVRLLAHALAPREAIRWALECARSQARSDAPPQVLAALERVEAWLADPNEYNRRTCGAAASGAGFAVPAGSAALAVFLSALSSSPAVWPGENLAALAAARAVALAALAEPGRAPERYFQFLKEGIALARAVASRL